MIHYIKDIVSVNDYTVHCLFNTGERRWIDLTEIIQKYRRINDGLISSLADKDYFKSVKLDSYGSLTWDNGVDFDPENLYRMSKQEIGTF